MRTLATAVVFLALSAGLTCTSLGDGVSVSVHEDLVKPATRIEPTAEPSDSYEARALGFVQIPAKVNRRGIEIDRSSPFRLQAEASLRVPAGAYRLILRARGSARLVVDGKTLAETDSVRPNSAGHESVPEDVRPDDPRWRAVAPGDQERIVDWTSEGRTHRVVLSVLMGERKMRPETGELSVSIVAPGGVPVLVGAAEKIELTDDGWTAFAESERRRIDALDAVRRRAAARSEDSYWNDRHALARQEVASQAIPPPRGPGNLVDAYLAGNERERDRDEEMSDDAAFLRRLALDTTGVIPDAAEVQAFLAADRPDKRARAIDAHLDDPRWADGWMGYWQDVLAENPGILKPTLNNTGPFRRYLRQAFADNKPFDRFATELIRMEGSRLYGGPAGFGVATQNDAPMAAKAHVLAKAFLAADMKCARCHDAPTHPFDQSDLFALAALLDGKPQVIPATSTVRQQEGGRKPAISVSLSAGDKVAPGWNLAEIGPEVLPQGALPEGATDRERLAALMTSPRNSRFAPVIVNRLWKRYLGRGLVEPVDDWDNEPQTVHSDLLTALARELMTHDYDLKHVARLILNSRAYQSRIRPEAKDPAAPARRRMSAEQLVDSLFAAVGKDFHAEELTLDPDSRRPPTEFLNLGVPRRAWEFTSTSNERDRPALSLPVTQSLVDVLQTFGWRPSRQDPLTVRDEATSPLQPALLANGLVTHRVTGLSDDSAITALCLKPQAAEALVKEVYLRILSRNPTATETARVVDYLGASYADRLVPGAKPVRRAVPRRRVTWSNHLSPEASTIQLEMEKAARAGDPPTRRLTTQFRERMEDVLWALVNSPEFLHIP